MKVHLNPVHKPPGPENKSMLVLVIHSSAIRFFKLSYNSNIAFITVDNIISADVTKLPVKTTYKTKDMKEALV